MLECEGYKMFHGTATVTPKYKFPPQKITGTWLYKPEYDCWYVNGSSYMAEIVSDIQDEEEPKVDCPSLSDVYFPELDKALDALCKAVME